MQESVFMHKGPTAVMNSRMNQAKSEEEKKERKRDRKDRGQEYDCEARSLDLLCGSQLHYALGYEMLLCLFFMWMKLSIKIIYVSYLNFFNKVIINIR